MRDNLESLRTTWIQRVTAWDREVCLESPSPALEAAIENIEACETVEQLEAAALWWRDAYEAPRIEPGRETFQEMAAVDLPPDELVRRTRSRALGFRGS